jgi:hypothetical protein
MYTQCKLHVSLTFDEIWDKWILMPILWTAEKSTYDHKKQPTAK